MLVSMKGKCFLNLPIHLCMQGKQKSETGASRKYKIPDHQNGQVYLTSHRICYVDSEDPRKNSTAIDLKDIERYEFYACLRKPQTRMIV